MQRNPVLLHLESSVLLLVHDTWSHLRFCCFFLKQDRDSREEFCWVQTNLWTLAKTSAWCGWLPEPFISILPKAFSPVCEGIFWNPLTISGCKRLQAGIGRDLRRAGVQAPASGSWLWGQSRLLEPSFKCQLGNCSEGGRTTSLGNLVHCWAFSWRERSFVFLFFKPIHILTGGSPALVYWQLLSFWCLAELKSVCSVTSPVTSMKMLRRRNFRIDPCVRCFACHGHQHRVQPHCHHPLILIFQSIFPVCNDLTRILGDGWKSCQKKWYLMLFPHPQMWLFYQRRSSGCLGMIYISKSLLTVPSHLFQCMPKNVFQEGRAIFWPLGWSDLFPTQAFWHFWMHFLQLLYLFWSSVKRPDFIFLYFLVSSET